MSALYIMRYVGLTGADFGCLYVGKGMVAGVDVGGIRYSGTYAETGGRIKGSVSMTAPSDGAQLVTGQRLPAGQSIVLTIDWSPNFSDGSQQSVSVASHPVHVTVEKISEIP